jgi:hypothetical protein
MLMADDTQPFTVRFCELSIACARGVQNRSLVLRLRPAVRPGPLACVVSSG